MKHKIETVLDQREISGQKITTRQGNNIKIIDAVREACDKLGGCAIIGDGYIVVDTRKYEVKEK